MEPIVFIPGLLCTETLFAPQIAAFSDRPILVADHRHHDTIEAIALHLLEQAPASFALAGLSMGGYVAMEVMRQAPERVSRLALIDTSPYADDAERLKRRQLLIKLTQRKGFTKVPHLLYPGFVHSDREHDTNLKSIVLDMAYETGAEAFIRQTKAIMSRVDSRSSLQEISCPTLVLVGDGDTLTPPHRAKEMQSLIPDSRLAIIQGSGHLPTLENPDETTAELKHWMGTSSPYAAR